MKDIEKSPCGVCILYDVRQAQNCPTVKKKKKKKKNEADHCIYGTLMGEGQSLDEAFSYKKMFL